MSRDNRQEVVGALTALPWVSGLGDRGFGFLHWGCTLAGGGYCRAMTGIPGQLLLWTCYLQGARASDSGAHGENGLIPLPYSECNHGEALMGGQQRVPLLGIPPECSGALGLFMFLWPRDTEAQK